MRKFFITVMLAFTITMIPSALSAQDDPPPPPGDEDPDAPIDGGLSLLIAAGVGYGVSRVYKGRKTHSLSASPKEE